MKSENFSKLVGASGLVAEVPALRIEDLRALRDNGIIPYHVWGQKTFRYDVERVKAALAKTEVKKISAK